MRQTFGNNLYDLRQKAGYTQQQLADLCKVSNAAVSKWEHDLSYPDITLLPILARIFRISIDELLNFKQALSEEEASDLAKEALRAYQEKDFPAAFAFTKELVHTYPNSEILRFRLVSNTMYVRMLVDKEAGEQYQSFAKALCDELLTSPTDYIREGTTIFLVNFCMENEAYEEAEQLILQMPLHVDTRSMLPSIYMSQGKHEEAEIALQQDLYQKFHAICMDLSSLASLANQQKDTEGIRCYVDLLDAVTKLFQIEELTVNYLPLREGYYENKQQAIDNLKRYVTQLLQWDQYPALMQDALRKTRWFHKVTLKNNMPQNIMGKEQLCQFLNDPSFDYLREEPAFQELYHSLA